MLGELVGGGVDFLSGNKASNIERRSTRKAGKYLDEGYESALDLARPMQEQAQGDYMNLSDGYGKGDFRNPDQQVYDGGDFSFKEQGEKFKFNPQDVFSDPEYQAQMQSGTQALESGAAGKGMLFSGNTGRALTQFGSDLFANRSNDLYNRGRSAFESDRGFDFDTESRRRDAFQDDRDFGFDAENRAYDTNAANRARDFSQGSELASYAPDALDRSLNLNLGRAQAKADTELGVGGIRGDAWRVGGQKGGRMATNLINGGKDLAMKLFGGGAA